MRTFAASPLVSLAAAALAACGVASSARAQRPPVAIVGVAVLDVEAGRLLPDRTILLEGPRIVAVGPRGRLAVPHGARRIDGTGLTAMPGLWDMHFHVDDAGAWMLPLAVREGVTGIRDMGGTPRLVARWRDRPASFPTPHVVMAGPIVTGIVPDSDPRVVQVADSAAAVAAVARLAASGVDFIKVHDWLTPDAYAAVLAEATHRGLPVAGHLPIAVSAVAAARAGQRSIEHLGNARGGMLIDCQADPATWRAERAAFRNDPFNPASLLGGMPADMLRRLAVGCSADRLAALADTLARHHVHVTPLMLSTFRLPLGGMPESVRRDALLADLPDAVATTARQQRDLDARVTARRATDAPVRAALLAAYRRMVRVFADHGVPILAGTDALSWPVLLPGSSLHQELQELVAAGLSPAEAIRAATLTPARYFGAADTMGTVAAGRVADLLLVRGDPLRDIRRTQDIAFVIRGGEVLDRAARDRLAAMARAATPSDTTSVP